MGHPRKCIAMHRGFPTFHDRLIQDDTDDLSMYAIHTLG